MRKILILAAVLAVSACATASTLSNPSDAETKYTAARLDLNALLLTALSYAEQPRCTDQLVVACSDGDVVDELLNLATAADTALDEAGLVLDTVRACREAAIASSGDPAACGDGSNAAVYIAGATGFLRRIQALVAAHVIKKGATT